MACLCMLEDSVQELTLSCHHVDPVAQTQVVRHLYPLSHLFSPKLTNLKQYTVYVERNITHTHTHTWAEKVGSRESQAGLKLTVCLWLQVLRLKVCNAMIN